MLTGWEIDILTEAEESERRTEEFKQRSQLFMQALDVDDVIAHLLVAEGFTRLEEIAYVPTEEIADIEGFDETIAGELQTRARTWLEEQNRQNVERYRELGVSDDLAAISPLTAAMLVALGGKGIKTLDDLADLASDELVEIVGEGALDEDAANTVIMAARAHWFDGEGAAAGEAPAAGA
jgi:N utilization substance protein A